LYKTMNVESIDHLVLTVKNINDTCAFYVRILGMQITTFAGGRKALFFGLQKINLHQSGQEFKPKASHPTPGSADLCFVTKVPIFDVISHLEENCVEILEGPVRRTGASGVLTSVYFRDPDGNLIEVANCD
jgi:catechol 2,3-dioxygenase-like lactoylglutathione lyase family enzyme